MKRFWGWYDNLAEPWRFLAMLFLVGSGIYTISQKPYAVFGGIYLVILLISRIICVYQKGR